MFERPGLAIALLVPLLTGESARTAGETTAATAPPPATAPAAGDWPMRGGRPCRNAVSSETGIPHEWNLETGENVKWVVPLGTYTYGGPVVAGGRVYVGTNNGGRFRPGIEGDKGCVLCFDAQTGKLLWQATHDKLPSGAANDWPEQGVASTPYVDGDRVYYVSNRCELVCADVAGFHDGRNDGPLADEKHRGPLDADFVWILDMMGELGVYPHNLAASSPVGAGELVFVCTGNGVDDEAIRPPAPQAPSFIAVSKRTGRVVWQRNDPGENILHGQWSSPAYGVIDGEPQVIFGGGDGWCYAFEPQTGALLWKFDLNPKDSVWKVGGYGTKTSIVATPVIYDDMVFLAVGDDPEQGRGPGHLYAIDARRRGDITESGRIWHVGGRDFGRTVASVAVADGLVYAVDLDGFLSCFDAKTGERHWRYDMEAAVWGSPCVADGKVLLGNTDGELVILRHGRVLKEIARHDMRYAIYTTPAVAGGVLYIATQRFLYAIAAPPASTTQPAAPPAAQVAADPRAGHPDDVAAGLRAGRPDVASDLRVRRETPIRLPPPTLTQVRGPESEPLTQVRGVDHWPMFRGNAQLTGVAGDTLPEKLHLRWRFEAPGPISSTAAIAAGVVYVGTDEDCVCALDLSDGRLKWRYQTRGAVGSSPTVAGELVIFGDDAGVLHAADARTGASRWTFRTQGQIISSANWHEDRVVFGSYDNSVYCLRLSDGQPLWRYETPERVHATPAIVVAAEPRVGRIVDQYVLVAGCDAHLHVVDLRDGTPVRQVALGSVTGCCPAVRGEHAFLGTYGQQVLAVDWQAGSVVWRFEDPQHSFPYLSSAAVTEPLTPVRGAESEPLTQVRGHRTDGLVIIGGRDKRVRALDLRTGRQRWEFLTRGRVDSSPVLVRTADTGVGRYLGQRVFVGSADGNLYALDLESGAEVWRFEAGSAITASPAVAAGCLVIGTQDGVLYCFGASPE